MLWYLLALMLNHPLPRPPYNGVYSPQPLLDSMARHPALSASLVYVNIDDPRSTMRQCDRILRNELAQSLTGRGVALQISIQMPAHADLDEIVASLEDPTSTVRRNIAILGAALSFCRGPIFVRPLCEMNDCDELGWKLGPHPDARTVNTPLRFARAWVLLHEALTATGIHAYYTFNPLIALHVGHPPDIRDLHARKHLR